MNHDSFTRWDTLAQTDLESASKNWGWVLVSGIAFVVLGVVALAFSVMTTLASVFVLGWILAFAVIFEAVHAFKMPRWSGVLLELLAAILYGYIKCRGRTHSKRAAPWGRARLDHAGGALNAGTQQR